MVQITLTIKYIDQYSDLTLLNGEENQRTINIKSRIKENNRKYTIFTFTNKRKYARIKN